VQRVLGLAHVHNLASLEQHQVLEQAEDLGLRLVDGADDGAGFGVR
jgi:hypothetical protein